MNHRPSNSPPSVARGGDAIEHMLSFDIEEYFQVQAASGHLPRNRWDDMKKRLPKSVDNLLSILDRYGATATFFVLGWVALHESDVVRRISRSGHEIASHGMDHVMLHSKNARTFREDSRRARQLLEDIAGKPVLGYRAPTFSITHRTAWAIDVLAEEGYRYDSSVFPIYHDRYGAPDAPPAPHIAIGPGGGSILEIPPLTFRALGLNIPVGGGGYFRLLPDRVVEMAISAAAGRGRRAMLYLHAWELDDRQPLVNMGLLGTLRHRLNLHRTQEKLQRLLGRYRFASVSAHLESLAESASVVYRYGAEAV